MYIIRHDLRIGNARHDEYIGRMVDVAFLQRVEVDKPSILIGRVQDRLIKTGRNICQDLGLFFRTQSLGTLGHDKHLGTRNVRHGLTQSARRQQHILIHDTVITAQANGKAWFHISMLHRIIKNDDLWRHRKFEQFVDSVDTIRINCNNKERKLTVELIWLVTD